MKHSPRSPARVLSSDEHLRRRRGRRTSRTSELEAEIRLWAEQRACSLRVLNRGHHWLFQRAGFAAEWWPGSAKLAVNRDYERTYQAPHWVDVIAVLQPLLLPPLAPTNTQAVWPLSTR
jgi:hypothetical protein